VIQQEKRVLILVKVSHLKSLRRDDLRWQRRNVGIVVSYLFLIQEWAIVRKLVPLRVRG
jgi:hypothetical protein